MSSGTLDPIQGAPESAQGAPRERPGRPGTGAEGPLGDKGGITNKDEEQELIYHAVGPKARRIRIALHLINSMHFQWNCINIQSVRALSNLPYITSSYSASLA